MLDVKEAIAIRRSIRHFRPDPIPKEIIVQLLEAARLAPSGANSQPWRFLVVRDKETKKELRHICNEQRFVEEAPVVFVCFADYNSFSVKERTKRGQEFVETGVVNTFSGFITDPKYREELETSPLPPREQMMVPLMAYTFIGIQNLVLMATALGLGTCWMTGYEDASAISRLFKLPDNLVPAAVVPVGYIAGKIPPPRPRLSLQEILIRPL